MIFRRIFGVFSRRDLLHPVENTPPKPAVWLRGGGGGTLCMWLGLAHFHYGYSFLMISPNLLDICQKLEILPSPNSKQTQSLGANFLMDAKLWRIYFNRRGDFNVRLVSVVVPRRLFFTALHWIAIAQGPKIQQKNKLSFLRKIQKEYDPDVM